MREKEGSLLCEKETAEKSLEEFGVERTKLEVMLGDLREEKLQLEERFLQQEKKFQLRISELQTEKEETQKAEESLQTNFRDQTEQLETVLRELTSAKV